MPRARKRSQSPAIPVPARAGGGHFATTRSSRIVSIDALAARILHREERILNGKPLAVFMDVADRQELRSRLALLPTGATIENWTLRLRTREGSVIRVLATLEAVHRDGDESDILEWSITPCEGPSDAHEIADPATQLDRELSELAHELNQPLAAIISYARGCILRSRNRQLTKADLESILESIAAEAHRAGTLLRTRVRGSKLPL